AAQPGREQLVAGRLTRRVDPRAGVGVLPVVDAPVRGRATVLRRRVWVDVEVTDLAVGAIGVVRGAGAIGVRVAIAGHVVPQLLEVVNLNGPRVVLEVEVAVGDVHPQLAGRDRDADGKVDLIERDGPPLVRREAADGATQTAGKKP